MSRSDRSSKIYVEISDLGGSRSVSEQEVVTRKGMEKSIGIPCKKSHGQRVFQYGRLRSEANDPEWEIRRFLGRCWDGDGFLYGVGIHFSPIEAAVAVQNRRSEHSNLIQMLNFQQLQLSRLLESAYITVGSCICPCTVRDESVGIFLLGSRRSQAVGNVSNERWRSASFASIPLYP